VFRIYVTLCHENKTLEWNVEPRAKTQVSLTLPTFYCSSLFSEAAEIFIPSQNMSDPKMVE
jgi:hypothetical protein